MQPNTFQFILLIIFLISPHSLSFNTGGGDGGEGMTSPETSSTPSGVAHGPNWDYNWGWGYGSGSGRSPNGLGRGWGFGFGPGSGFVTGNGYGSGSGGGGSGGYDSGRAP
ncbi:hypothetical protein K7X08_016903 [Anisodus acutangulus]|uniref:Glycine-rich cell wall structural protein 1 n=1 Tax=Anisodus acutangulus TaxID=402998 RepID=A0A9Q1LTP2_9SOLA|nr:hypothetical protein K7X08_016903 [Anisodus acutangulus]